MALDFSMRKIPNVLSLGGCAVGAVWLIVTGHTMTGAGPLLAVLGFGLALLLTLPAYVIRMLGAGDVKFLGAIALLCGLRIVTEAFLLGALIAGVAAIFYLVLSHFMIGRYERKPIPFGAALAAALIVSLLHPDSLGLRRWLA